jgi:hypothetical protein
MLGGNLPENRPFELNLFSNDEVLAVNQHGENPRQLYKKDGSMVWYSHVQGSKDLYVALFNLNDSQKDVSVDLADLGIKGKASVRDLWKKKNLGLFGHDIKQTINTHGAALLRISPSN